MPYLEIDFSELTDVARQCTEIKSELNQIMSDFQNQASALDWKITGKENLDRRFSDIYDSLSSYAEAWSQLGTFLQDTVNSYMRIEEEGKTWKPGRSIRGAVAIPKGSHVSSMWELITSDNSYGRFPPGMQIYQPSSPVREFISLLANEKARPIIDKILSELENISTLLEITGKTTGVSIPSIPGVSLIPYIETVSDSYNEYSKDGNFFNIQDISATVIDVTVQGLLDVGMALMATASLGTQIAEVEALKIYTDEIDLAGQISTGLKNWGRDVGNKLAYWYLDHMKGRK